MHRQHRYNRIERERRFLLNQMPIEARTAGVRHIEDRYIDDTRLRLRRQSGEGGPEIFKLTQKIPSPGSGAQQGYLTTMYLNAEEFRTIATLPAKQLSKTRYSVPPFGIDRFEGLLEGLLLAEAEFDSAAEAESLILASFIGSEVTKDLRFTGGSLAHASRQTVADWLGEYGARFMLPSQR